MSDSVQLTVAGKVSLDDVTAIKQIALNDNFDLWRIDCSQEVAPVLVNAIQALQLNLRTVKITEQDFVFASDPAAGAMMQAAEFAFSDFVPAEQEVLDGIEAFKTTKLDAIILRQFGADGETVKYLKLANVVHASVKRAFNGADGTELFAVHKLAFGRLTEHVEQPA